MLGLLAVMASKLERSGLSYRDTINFAGRVADHLAHHQQVIVRLSVTPDLSVELLQGERVITTITCGRGRFIVTPLSGQMIEVLNQIASLSGAVIDIARVICDTLNEYSQP